MRDLVNGSVFRWTLALSCDMQDFLRAPVAQPG